MLTLPTDIMQWVQEVGTLTYWNQWWHQDVVQEGLGCQTGGPVIKAPNARAQESWGASMYRINSIVTVP